MSGKPKNKIDNLFKDYEQMLGESLDQIEAHSNSDAFDDDPEMKQIQMMIEKQQKQLPKKQEIQQVDVDLDAYERMMRGEEENKAPVKAQANNFIQVFLQQEQQFTDPREFKSLLLIQHEINVITKENMQQPQVKNNQELMALYQDILGKLRYNQTSNLRLFDEGKLDIQKYIGIVDGCFQTQQKQYILAKQQNAKMFQMRIGGRLTVLENEKKDLQQNNDAALQRIISQVKNQKQASNLPDKQIIKKQESASKLMQNHYDQDTREEKFIALLKMHKKNHNFTTYLLNHFKEQRAQDIQFLVTSLEKSKALRDQFLAGGNPQIGSLMMYDLTDVTFERFHKMNHIEYQSKLAVMIEQINKARVEEENFLNLQQKIAPTQKIIIPQKGADPAQASKSLISEYVQLQKYLFSLEQKEWVPLPQLQKKEEVRMMVADNRDIPANTLRIKFKRLMNVEEGKYHILFSLEVNGVIVTLQTDSCQKGSVFNYQKDIPLAHDKKSLAAGEIHTKVIEVRIMEKGFFSDSTKGQAMIPLSDLEQTHTMEGTIHISQKNDRASLEYGIYLREPTSKGKKKVDVYKLVKIYPEFVLDDGIAEFVNNMMASFRAAPNSDKIKENVQHVVKDPQVMKEDQGVKKLEKDVMKEEIKVVEEKQEEQPQPIKLIMLVHMENDPEYSNIIKLLESLVLPEGITREDVLNPENPHKAMVFSFVEQYGPFLSQKLIEVRQDSSMRPQSRFLQNMYDEYLRCISKIQKRLEAQDYDWYRSQITPSLTRDEKLIQIYKKAGASTWVEFMQVRMDVTAQEIKELDSQ